MLAREHLWQLAPSRNGAATRRWRWLQYCYVLAVPLLLALEVAVAVEHRIRTRPESGSTWLEPPPADAEEAVRWRERRRAAALVRRRFRRGRGTAAALGGGLASLVIGWQLALPAARGGVDGASALGALVLLALGTAGPWLLVDLLRRWTERRYYWEWQ